MKNNNEKDMKEILTEILAELKSINQSISSLQNLKDHDHDHNQSIRSDQIRSDLISNKGSNIEIFTEYLEKYGIEYQNLDLVSKSRNIDYFLKNLNKITSKKNYIKSILKDCPRIAEQPAIYTKKDKAEPNPKDIMGINSEEVESKTSLVDQRAYESLYPLLSKAEKNMFSSLNKIKSNTLLINIFTAKCIKEGII